MLRNKHQSGISSNFAHLSKNLLHSSKRRIHDVLKAQSSGRPTSEYTLYSCRGKRVPINSGVRPFDSGKQAYQKRRLAGWNNAERNVMTLQEISKWFPHHL